MIPLTREQIESVMKQGEEAFLSGMKRQDTKDQMPYSRYSDAGRLWLRGYANAEYGSEHGSKKK